MVKAENDSGNGLISNKKPRKAMLAKSMLYGSFVKVKNDQMQQTIKITGSSVFVHGNIAFRLLLMSGFVMALAQLC